MLLRRGLAQLRLDLRREAHSLKWLPFGPVGGDELDLSFVVQCTVYILVVRTGSGRCEAERALRILLIDEKSGARAGRSESETGLGLHHRKPIRACLGTKGAVGLRLNGTP